MNIQPNYWLIIYSFEELENKIMSVPITQKSIFNIIVGESVGTFLIVHELIYKPIFLVNHA